VAPAPLALHTSRVMQTTVPSLAKLVVVAALACSCVGSAPEPSSGTAGRAERESETHASTLERSDRDEDSTAVSWLSLKSAAVETARVRVRVVERATGAPLAGKSITAQPVGVLAWSVAPTESARAELGEAPTSDASGYAELAVVARHAHTLLPFGSSNEEGVESPALEPGAVHDVTLPIGPRRPVIFSARLVDRETREPLAHARVTDAVERDAASVLGLVYSDELGHFQLRLTSSKPLCVRAWTPTHSSVLFDVDPARVVPSETVEISMPKAAHAEVVVLEAGVPVPDVGVMVLPEDARLGLPLGWGAMCIYGGGPYWRLWTDENGVARFWGLPAGQRLGLELMQGDERKPSSVKFALEPGENRRLEANLDDLFVIRGEVLLSSGAPAAGVEVARERVGETLGEGLPAWVDPIVHAEATTFTDEQGRFEFRAVPPGAWGIGLASQDSWPAEQRLACIREHLDVAGEEKVFEVTLRAERGLYIEGQVVASDSIVRPVLLRAVHEPTGAMLATFTDKSGGFRLGPVLAGEHVLTVQGGFIGGLESRASSAALGATNVVLRWPWNGTLNVRVLGVANEAAQPYLQLAKRGYEHQAGFAYTRGGVHSLSNLPPGEYSIMATAPDGRFAWVRDLTVSGDGPPQSVELALEPGAVIELHGEQPDPGDHVQLVVDGVVVARTGLGGRRPTTLVGPPGQLELSLDFYPSRRRIQERLTLAPGERRIIATRD